MEHLVTNTQAPSPGEKDPNVVNRFTKKDQETKGDLGTEDGSVKKSTLVEIPTPTSRILYTAKGTFPFDFFPDELIIDEIKVNVIFNGPLTRRVNSILIKDITDILVTSNPFFGSLLINGGEYQGLQPKEDSKGPLQISFLKPEEAREARRIVLGLMVFSDQKIDSSTMSVDQVLAKTQELGKAKELPV